jgi:hypothetical protein
LHRLTDGTHRRANGAQIQAHQPLAILIIAQCHVFTGPVPYCLVATLPTLLKVLVT